MGRRLPRFARNDVTGGGDHFGLVGFDQVIGADGGGGGDGAGESKQGLFGFESQTGGDQRTGVGPGFDDQNAKGRQLNYGFVSLGEGPVGGFEIGFKLGDN